MVILLLAVAILLMSAFTVTAQQQQPVTDDEVNAIAGKLYCPVCENIPLDTCPTAACQDWRYEIRLQLEDGKTEQEIVDDFVVRFGDRVVGTPQDPTLRALSLVTPYVFMGFLLAGLASVFISWRRSHHRTPVQQTATETAPKSKYYELLERDLEG